MMEAFKTTLTRCTKAIAIYDPQAVVRAEVTLSGSHREFVYVLACDSAGLAVGRRKVEPIAGIGSSLESAEQLFLQGLAIVIAERSARDARDRRKGMPVSRKRGRW